MTQRTASETRALRRSSRLASSHASEESCKPAVQLRTRRTTGQLRLPSSSTPTPKRGAKKRSTVASRRFKSKSRRRGSSSARDSTQSDEIPKLSSRDICREIPLYEPVGAATKDCIYCYPNSAYNRCCHNRGQPVPESPGSVLGQNVILPSVETDDKPVRLFRGGHPISLEEERNVQEVIDMLAKKREQDQLWRAASNPPASEHSISVPSVNQHGDVMVKPEPATTSPVCMGPPIHQSVQQVGSRQNCLPLQGSHVRFADASSDSYVSDGTVGTSGKDTEKWKKKLLLFPSP
ncbi:hypothetical protein Sste5346_005780 [Sporothrix stenoceras]|uniref:Uncharacterized protein n=1 Tax=Sporothrix stenoceras TaxID=5173 RepID=A0ABR3Z2P6_9PEZI